MSYEDLVVDVVNSRKADHQSGADFFFTRFLGHCNPHAKPHVTAPLPSLLSAPSLNVDNL